MQRLHIDLDIHRPLCVLDPLIADPPLPRAPVAPGRLRVGMLSTIAMAQLIVRDIDKKLVDLLKRRAAAHGRSAEAEHREILRAVLQPPPMISLKDHLLDMPDVGDDADFAVERSRGRKVTL
jgi:antitoxin FitA